MSNSNTDTGDTTVTTTTSATVQDYNPNAVDGEVLEPRESLVNSLKQTFKAMRFDFV